MLNTAMSGGPKLVGVDLNGTDFAAITYSPPQRPGIVVVTLSSSPIAAAPR